MRWQLRGSCRGQTGALGGLAHNTTSWYRHHQSHRCHKTCPQSICRRTTGVGGHPHPYRQLHPPYRANRLPPHTPHNSILRSCIPPPYPTGTRPIHPRTRTHKIAIVVPQARFRKCTQLRCLLAPCHRFQHRNPATHNNVYLIQTSTNLKSTANNTKQRTRGISLHGPTIRPTTMVR